MRAELAILASKAKSDSIKVRVSQLPRRAVSSSSSASPAETPRRGVAPPGPPKAPSEFRPAPRKPRPPAVVEEINDSLDARRRRRSLASTYPVVAAVASRREFDAATASLSFCSRRWAVARRRRRGRVVWQLVLFR